jgi:hypothetical protein
MYFDGTSICHEPAPDTQFTVEIFSATARQWRLAAPMSIGRQYHTATLLLDGRVLVAGSVGQDCNQDQWPPLNTTEIYDPVGDLWVVAAPMNEARAMAAAALLHDGRVLVSGGSGDPTAEVYDPIKNEWTYTGPMHQVLSQHQALTIPDGRVIVTGWGDTEFYNPSSGQWTEGPPEPPRYDHFMFLLPSGRVFQTGGPELDDIGHPTITADILDLATGVWSSIPPVSRPRFEPGATQLADGTILIAGGSPDGEYYSSASVDLFDDNTNTWVQGADMLNQRMYVLLSPFLAGALAVFGSEECWLSNTTDLEAIPPSELYQP